MDFWYNIYMKQNMKIMVFFIIMVVLGVFVFFGVGRPKGEAEKMSIISTGYIGYDFARAVAGDRAEVKMLLKPGSEAHDFEPTPQDLIDISKADLFIYVGGESDEWVAKLLKDNEISGDKVLRLMDEVELKKEEIVEGMEGEDEGEDGAGEEEYDEHVWTSPKNAMRLVEAVARKLGEVEPSEKGYFEENAKGYISKIDEVDKDFREIISSSPRKELIFGDRFPFRYFVDEYGLKYYAAFPGCSEQTEASSGTVAFLIDKVKKDGINIVLKIELTSGALAETIARETGAKVMEFSAGHNISEEDFSAGVTYVDLLRKNVEVLREALR